MKLIENKPSTKQLIKYGIATILWILWMIWMKSIWMLIGLPIILDIYISKKVKWNIFKQKEGEPKKKWKEWADALIFALVVSALIKVFIFQLYAIPTGSLEKTMLIGDRLFVSKLSYGPRMPFTPISFPLVHNVLPFTKKTNSYLEWIKWKYKRLAGIGKIERDDIVVFNFPVGDTIIVGYENPDYYEWVRQYGKDRIFNEFEVKARPIDKKENFVKRCVAIPGDTLQIIDSKVFINHKAQPNYKGIQYNYIVKIKEGKINPMTLGRMGIYTADSEYDVSTNQNYMPLTDEMVEKFKQYPSLEKIEKTIVPKEQYDAHIFPHNPMFPWNYDNFGPLVIPKKGMTIDLNEGNIILYRRVIDVYDENNYEEKNGKVYIDGKEITKYTFKQNYYWMMGDNRHNSADSRAWGFVPENHTVGKPVMIFYSLNEEKSFPSNIRWDRIFRIIGKE
ncbi:MAG: S26 family signal peptidase [Bacteroidales bacterium]|nr:S26 family signal peptidase [Bacteroidales bacterium]MBN2758061.1 S26 family signal peptidase [Bacteroidales bacterium]